MGLLRQHPVVNDLPAGGTFLFIKAGTSAASIVNNIFSGPGEILNGPGELRYNVVAKKTDFVDAANFDYRLRQGAAAIGFGVDPGSVHGLDLRPSARTTTAQASAPGRIGGLDAGPWVQSTRLAARDPFGPALDLIAPFAPREGVVRPADGDELRLSRAARQLPEPATHPRTPAR
jgi:hypothetical protein